MYYIFLKIQFRIISLPNYKNIPNLYILFQKYLKLQFYHDSFQKDSKPHK